MSITYKNLVMRIKDRNLTKELLQCNFGIEKENVRVNQDGELAMTPHPKAFGDKLKNPYIITDFSESQVEMITPILDTPEECYNFLENLHHIVSSEIGDELLWPSSMPPRINNEEDIKIAEYNGSAEGVYAREYREHLAAKYGAKKQLISGIHYNFSFKDSILETLYSMSSEGGTFQEFKNNVYLKIARNFTKYGWVLNYLMGTSVAVDKSYTEKDVVQMEALDENTYYMPYATSIRNSYLGYKNPEDFLLSYSSVEAYVEEIQGFIDSGEIKSAAEFYSPIRLKAKNNKSVLKSLKQDGIAYIEIRSVDLNPINPIGLALEDVKFIHLFIIFMLFNLCDCFSKDMHEIALVNWNEVAIQGRRRGAMVQSDPLMQNEIKDIVNSVLRGMNGLIDQLEIKDDHYKAVVEHYQEVLKVGEVRSCNILRGVKECSFIGYHIEKAKEYRDNSYNKRFNLIGYEDLELSTQILIKDSLKRGLKVKVIDRSDNFITIENNYKKEYVKQATKTSLDSYITFLIMENKVVTKVVLEEAGIRVANGEVYNHTEEALDNYSMYYKGNIVIKPKSTNFGVGITIFKNEIMIEDYEAAIQLAFSKDSTVLIEQFIEGKEYRFTVIGDEVAGILHRVPANVCGDGDQNIRALVEEKNENPLRGTGYVKPLEKIKCGKVEEMFLAGQGLDFNYVPKRDEVVYLRENSNVSTGGDSIDFTDIIGDDYKAIAIQSAKACGAKICGVDMMIRDVKAPCTEDEYAIIEVNFNPAIHIHCYPHEGKNRELGNKMLDILGF